jgi:hypothetical protein
MWRSDVATADERKEYPIEASLAVGGAAVEAVCAQDVLSIAIRSPLLACFGASSSIASSPLQIFTPTAYSIPRYNG